MKKIYISMAMVLTTVAVVAQCPNPGEVEVYIDVLTDDYGYETYWQLTPQGDDCGTNTIFEGGNLTVGCNGGGAQVQDMSGYGDVMTINEGPFCLLENEFYHIHSIDDWGDGQAGFNVYIDGALVAEFTNASTNVGPQTTHTFQAAPPVPLDLTVSSLLMGYYETEGNNMYVRGEVKNLGGDVITDFDLIFAMDNGLPVLENISGLNLASGEIYEFVANTPWPVNGPGLHDLTVWCANPNGSADMNPANDQVQHDIIVNPAIPDLHADYLLGNNSLEVVGDVNTDILVPRDLDFHPDHMRMELWVANKDTENSGGSTVTFNNVGESNQTFEWKRDGNAWHFMSLPTGLAMGDNDNFATSPGVFDANHNGAPAFTGPSLWSTDMSIYAEPSGGNGSHLDMLHVNPECQGIAHELLNRYWVVDGFTGDIVMNDFKDDHGPGNDYHGDAVIKRYADFTIQKDPNDHIVSHAELDKNTGWLYVVDHGGQRILRMDINTGVPGGAPTYPQYESYEEYSTVTGYDWEVIVNTGLVEPAGIDVIHGKMYVTDHSNGDIIIYDIEADPVVEMGRISTGAAGIMGITVGPYGRLWYVNASTNELVRVEPGSVGIDEAASAAKVVVHPNPGAGMFYFSGLNDADQDATIQVMDVKGQLVRTAQVSTVLKAGLDLSELANGVYNISVVQANNVANTRIVISK